MPTLNLIYQPSTGDWPTPRAWVAVETYGVLAGGGPLLTPECASLDELEAQVELLREELDAILEDARARFGATGEEAKPTRL